ncbi:alpha/beta hydrolase [Sphingomonas deserti]|uniref:Alpha/beta hydrolase n=2 Tax=Allosphingosinicella deserti TaxID=2116704 RepID=A0A2P7QP74_9SPHN|nr:alpha/beta hydrolase [Sphingomonas deserti]
MVFFHGNAGNRFTGADLAAPLRRDDVDLIVASYRGYGGNPGEPSEEGLYRDAAAFIREAQASRPRKTYLFDFSLGGAVALHSANRFTTEAVVTLGAFSNLKSVAPRLVRAFIPYEFDNLTNAKSLKVPWLLLHGTADETVPIAEAEKLAAAAGTRATFVRLPGAPHNVALDQIATRMWTALDPMPPNPEGHAAQAPVPARCGEDPAQPKS